MRENVILLLKGMVVGVANIIPGVSGGTMAVVLGIYEQLIEAIGNFFGNREKRRVYLAFLFKLGLGAIVAILALSWVMDYLLTYHRIYTYLFFIGLIAGSIPSIYRTHPDMKLNGASVVTFLGGAGLIAFFTVLAHRLEKPTDPAEVAFVFSLWGGLKLIFAGFLSGGSMIVPGISGSFMLVLLGVYDVVIRAVKTLQVVPLALLGIGIALGIWAFAKVIDVLLKHYPKETFYFILGLVVASLFSIFPGFPATAGGIALGGGIVVVAAAISYLLGERTAD